MNASGCRTINLHLIILATQSHYIYTKGLTNMIYSKEQKSRQGPTRKLTHN